MSILKIFFFHPPALHFALCSSGVLRLYLKLVLSEDLINLWISTEWWLWLCYLLMGNAWNMKNCKQLFFGLNCAFWLFRTDHNCGRSLYLMGMHIYICSTRIHCHITSFWIDQWTRIIMSQRESGIDMLHVKIRWKIYWLGLLMSTLISTSRVYS